MLLFYTTTFLVYRDYEYIVRKLCLTLLITVEVFALFTLQILEGLLKSIVLSELLGLRAEICFLSTMAVGLYKF